MTSTNLGCRYKICSIYRVTTTIKPQPLQQIAHFRGLSKLEVCTRDCRHTGSTLQIAIATLHRNEADTMSPATHSVQ